MSDYEDPLEILERVRRNVWDHTDWNGRYGEETPLGRGSLGVVTVARDLALRRRVAIKRLREDFVGDPDAELRFFEEAQITSQLQHPHVLPVHDIGIDGDGRPFFAMSYLRRGTFANQLQRARDATDAGPRHLAVRSLEHIARAIAFAHDRGVAHRDIKPANVVVGRSDEVYVADWGLARSGFPAVRRGLAPPVSVDRIEHLLSSMLHLGSPGYMAPEQARCDVATIGPPCDVYAIGAMLYELLTGAVPHARPGESTTAMELLERVRSDPPPPIPVRRGTPRVLAKIAAAAMARDPAERPAAIEVAQQLADWTLGRQRRPSRVASRLIRAMRGGTGSAGPASALDWTLPDRPGLRTEPTEPPSFVEAGDAPARAPKATASRGFQHPRYAIERRIASGGMATVHTARDRVLGRALAMKLLRPELASHADLGQRLVQEARVMAQLDHPGVPRVHDGGSHDGTFFYVMDLLPDQKPAQARFAALSERGRHRREAVFAVLQTAARVADVLDHAHRRGVIHRDVKPSNIYVGHGGEILLGDWGLHEYRRAHSLDPSSTTMHGAAAPFDADHIVGTPGFMPPEACRRGGLVGPWSDVWALAATTFARLVGAAPHAAAHDLAFSGDALLLKHIELAALQIPAVRELAPAIPKPLAACLDRSLSPMPAVRPSAAEFAHEFRAIAGRI